MQGNQPFIPAITATCSRQNRPPQFAMNRQLLLLALLALLAINACAAPPPRPIPIAKPGYSQALLIEINRYRLANGHNPLTLDPYLTSLAQTHSQDMFNRQKASHRDIDERFRQVNSSLCVENVGSGYRSPQEILTGWRQSRRHNRNLLREGINRAGIAEVGNYVTLFACN